MHKISLPRLVLTGLLLLVVVAVSSCSANPSANPSATGASVSAMAQVSQTTYVETFETTGSISPVNSASLSWTTTGTVQTVAVQPGDNVSAGEVLMTLLPTSTSLSSAEKEVETARAALETLTVPEAAAVTAAGKTLAGAFTTWRQARSDLYTGFTRYYAYGDRTLYTAWKTASTALDSALNALPLATASLDIQAAFQAVSAANRLEDFAASAQAASETAAEEAALQQKKAGLLSAAQASRTLADSRLAGLDVDTQALLQTLVEALDVYDQSAASFMASLTGASAFEYAVRLNTLYTSYQSSSTALESAIASLYTLARQPDPDAYASALERLADAEESLLNLQETLRLVAPFAGQVVAVNYGTGDSADNKMVAVELVDRQHLDLTLSIEEARVLKLKTGDVAQITLEARPEVALSGRVAYINPIGIANQGVVYYSVQVTIEQPETEVLIGATAGILIQISDPRQVLVVPVTSIQNDTEGEYVYRITDNGSYQRVSVTSGLILADDTVIIEGDLGVGDNVAVFALTSSSSQNVRVPGMGIFR